jgi:hypothetical protein
MWRSWLMLMLILSGTYAHAASTCPSLLQPDALRTWNALYKSFESYRQCDDSAIGEDYSEAIARILVDHWNTLPDLARIQSKDGKFRSFVLKHIDATLDENDVRKIRKNASAQCPAGLRKLCADMKTQANLALKELE